MRVLLAPSLSRRILLFMVFGIGLTSGAIIWRTEVVMEQAFLEQAKRQALVFLMGLEGELQDAEQQPDAQSVQALVDRVSERELDALGFSINKLYAYDLAGHVIAHSVPGSHADKDLSGLYGEVLSSGSPHIGQEVEYALDPTTRERVAKTDVIVPLRWRGGVFAALEVEINLAETIESVRRFDDRYEQEILILVAVSGGLALLFLWGVVHRWLIRPIGALGAVTGRIAGGDLSSRAEDLGADELGRLGRSVNHMADSIERLVTEQEEAHLQMLQSLAKALEAKDAYTAGHSGRVTKFAVQLGQRLGLPDEQLQLLRQGALMHDVGKIGIAETILNKPGPLDEHEYETIKKHPVLTAAIMRPLKRFKAFAEIAAWHHERWDGNGYPDGLKGEQIPLLARIVAIADTWDAMTGDRIYRKGMAVEKALSILERERDSGQWDPHLIDVFIDMVRGDVEARREVADDMFASD